MKQTIAYPNIDMIQSGLKIKKYIVCAGMSVKDIQEYLHLSCPQPIYRWMNGKILPSVDHLFMLSVLFGVHMEDLIVKKQAEALPEAGTYPCRKFEDRLFAYYTRLSVFAM